MTSPDLTVPAPAGPRPPDESLPHEGVRTEGDRPALDAGPVPALDRLTRLAAEFLEAPVAAVSVVEGDRQLVPGCVGLPEPYASLRELPLSYSVCRHVVETGRPLAVRDARGHPLLADAPGVAALGIVAYLGVPLTTAAGEAVGALCVVDRVPRAWTDRHRRVLEDLAAAAMSELALRHETAERRRAAEAAEGSRAVLAAVLDGISEAVYVKDVRGRYAVINRSGAAMLGRTVAEVLGQTDVELFGAAAAAAILERDTDAMRTGEPLTYEETQWMQGRPVELLSTKIAYRDRAGAVAGCIGITRDVTARKAAEAALTDSERRHRLVFERSPLPMWVYDAETLAFLAVNDAAVAEYGWSREEFLARTILDIRPPDKVAAARAALAAHGPGRTTSGEHRHWRKDGSTVVMSIVSHGLVWEGREARLVLATDVTDRRAAEAALRESESRFRSLSAASPVGVFLTDRRGAATYVNPRLCQIWQRPEAELLGGGWMADVHPDDLPALIEAWSAAVERGTEYEGQFRLTSAGGLRWVHCHSAPLHDGDGEAVGSVGSVEDVTERVRLEEELRHAQKMDAVGRLAGGIAHDFNNLLTVITANVEFLSADLAPGTQARADADEVRAAATRAAGLTRQLLAFSRKQVLQAQVLDPNAVVADVERLLRRVIGENITLTAALDPGAGRIKADPGQIEQVLVNLAVNARDAMPGGGTLTLRTAALAAGAPAPRGGRLPTRAPRGCVLLSVADTGAGMDERTRERAFDPFFTTKGPGHGTGLGLATVYGIVEQSGATVWIDSAPGRGTTVTVCLPVVDDPLPAAPAPPPAAARDGAGTVLIAEDEDGVRALTRRLLAARGYTVIEARDGAEALERWRAARAAGLRVDALVTDVVMPAMGGRELARRLRDEEPALPVVFMSGYAEGGVPELPAGGGEAVGGGPTHFLAKPFTADGLVGELGRLLRR